MSKFKLYEGSNTINVSTGVTYDNKYIKDENENYIYIGFTDGTTYDGLINNFKPELADTKEKVLGVNVADTSLCTWTIDENDNTDDTNTAKRILITIKNPLKVPARTFILRYNKVSLLKIKNTYFNINRTISVNIVYEERLVDNVYETYDIYTGFSDVILDESLPFKLNFKIFMKYKDDADDNLLVTDYIGYFDIDSTTAIIEDDDGFIKRDTFLFDHIEFYNNGGYKLGEKEDKENNILENVTINNYKINVVSSITKL